MAPNPKRDDGAQMLWAVECRRGRLLESGPCDPSVWAGDEFKRHMAEAEALPLKGELLRRPRIDHEVDGAEEVGSQTPPITNGSGDGPVELID
jgi:hypothetical protein